MIFSKHNLSSWIFFPRGRASRRFRLVVCALALVAAAVGLTRLHLRSAQAQQTSAPETGALHSAAALDRLKQDGQYESLQAALRQVRLTVSRAEATPLGRAAWHAPNPEAGYDAYVTEAGVSIAVNDESYVSLSLHSLGYGHAMQGVAPGKVSGDKQTINITRNNGVQEWYVNGPDGLEQGFTLAEPPGARHQGVPLRLALQVSEGWRAVASKDGQRVILRGAGDQAVEYSKLVVSDSVGRNVPARLTVADEKVVIEVEDSEATYPLTIDPIFTFQQKLVGADTQKQDYYGDQVALSGNTVVVSATGDLNAVQGSVYVFTRSGATWTFQQKITAFDGGASDLFGSAVALYGNTLAVGASNSGNPQTGSTYVYTRSGATWTFQQKLMAYDAMRNDQFGYALAMTDSTLAVGAYGADINGIDGQGAVYVFTRSGAAWTFQQKITAADGATFDYFGTDVALDGDTVAIGAKYAKIGTNKDQGAAYVFRRYGATWLFEKKLTAFDGAADDYFGGGIALSGNTVAVGAKRKQIGTNGNQGAAYVYTRSGTVWTFQQRLTANDGTSNDYFGGAVALLGDTAVVSAHFANLGAGYDQGAVYAFTRNVTVWTQIKKLYASDGQPYDRFGSTVALSSDTLAVGARNDQYGPTTSKGAAYVFAIAYCSSLSLLPESLPNGAIGNGYQHYLLVSGGAGPFQFTLVGGALPPGLSLTSGGKLAGTFTALGTYQFTIRATSLSTLCSTERKYTITVTEPCPAITIEPATLPDGLIDKPYFETLTATGGKEPYTFTAGGMMPPGLELSPEGILKGIPTELGSFGIRVTARDNVGCYATRSYTITITKEGAKIRPKRDSR
ncbi:MAG: putative Ig domain-containing protein [Blastocatellia bacterium]